MSAHVSYIDEDSGVLWIVHDGRADELTLTLRHYGIGYVPAFQRSQIGIEFRKVLYGKAFSLFKTAACEVIDVLTARRGISPREERTFGLNLMVVQAAQPSTDSPRIGWSTSLPPQIARSDGLMGAAI